MSRYFQIFHLLFNYNANYNISKTETDVFSFPRVDLHANYIRLKVEQGRGVFEYEVKYSPDIDSRPLRYKLLNQHTAALGGAKIFDGTILYLSRPMQQEVSISLSNLCINCSFNFVISSALIPVLSFIFREQYYGQNIQWTSLWSS